MIPSSMQKVVLPKCCTLCYNHNKEGQTTDSAGKLKRRTNNFEIVLCILLTCVFSFCFILCAEAKTVRPLETDPDSVDLANGSFCAGVDNPEAIPEGHFTLTLGLEDSYATEEIKSLDPGDTVVVNGKEYDVELVIIHGLYDEDGDGEYDADTTAVRDAEKHREIIDRLELSVTEDKEIVPYAYEVCAEDDYSLVFCIVSDTACFVQYNDCTMYSPVGTVEVLLPLPESFSYYDFSGGEENGPLTAEEFIENVTTHGSFNPYNTSAVLKNGLLVKIGHSDYPEGPEE